MQNKKDKEMELMIAESVLKDLPDHKLIAAKSFFDNLFDFKRLRKLYNTYIEGVETALNNTQNGRMYVNYNLDGTVTGRLSNSGGNTKKGGGKSTKIGVSFHTLPREQVDFNIREYVIAPPGWDFITCDYKGMELRILAHVAREKNMISAFQEGIDLHDFTTEMVFSVKKKNCTEDDWKRMRQICKAVSFLTVFGGTAYTLANKQNLSESKADEIIKSWFKTFPGIESYMATVDDYIKQFKYAKTIFGRYRHLTNIDSPIKSIRREAFRQGLNFTIQSPASDILVCGLIGISNKLKERKLKAKLAGTVHDSIELISPKNETAEVAKIVNDELVNYAYMRKNFNMELTVPLEVDIEVGPSFGSGEKYKITA
jgi:DNA polymerase-1